MEKATRQQLKDHNSRLVLRMIYNGGETSRADVARLTGLTRPTVSTIVASLIEEELVIETGQGQSAGGKRPTLLSIDGDGRALLAVDLSGAEFRAARLNLKGEVTDRAVLPAAGLRGEEVLERVFQLVETLLAGVSSPLLGIGVATPGLVDPHNGVVLRSVNLGWVDLPLRDLLEARFGRPVHVANDSHMAALAEYTYGEKRAGDNLIVIRVGRGIGAGVILGGRPFYGDGFGAGEVGHVVVDPDGNLCTCGNRGCLETTSSINAILRSANAAERSHSLLDGPDPVTWKRFVEAVNARVPAATGIAARAGCNLGIAVAHLVGAYNIQHVVLAGRVADLGDLLLNAVNTEMRRRVLPSMAEMTTVRFPSLDTNRMGEIVTLGCSALLLHREMGVV
jgi:predicted NBD/HSP70 family sugar kinase